MYNRVVSVITRAYDERSDEELEALLAWFSNKARMLQALQRDVLLDILRHCDFQVAERDDVVICQGDVGDSFYVVLHGSVSCYVNTEGPPAAAVRTQDAQTPLRPEGSLAKKKLDRARFGKFVASLEAGKSFGELALLSNDCIRNASVIADERSDLLVINRTLFDRCLKAAHEHELQQRLDFAHACPLFDKWAPKYKRQVGLSLRRETLPFDALIAKQGAPLDGLLFILKGQAKVMLDPSMHLLQYQHQHQNQFAGNPYTNTPKSARKLPPAVQRHVYEVSLIGPNEIIGDVEHALGLPTYMATLVSTQPVELYCLDGRNFERLFTARGDSRDLAHLRLTAAAKLHGLTLRGLQRLIPLLGHLATRAEQLAVAAAEAETAQTPTPTQTDTPTRHKQLLTFESFIPTRGPVIDFFGPGTVFYRNRLRRQTSLRRAALRNPPTPTPPLKMDGDVEAAGHDKDKPTSDVLPEENSGVCVESSPEHLLQLERRIKEWHSVAMTSHGPRRPRPAPAPALAAWQLRRVEPQRLTLVKPGAQVYLFRRAYSRPPASAPAHAPAAARRAASRQPSVKYIDSTGRPVEKELTPSDYEALRSLLRQKAQEFQHS